MKKIETKSGRKLKKIYLLAIGMWFVFVILFIVNGVLRNDGYGPILKNELFAHQLSTITGLVLLFIVMYFFFERTSARYTQKDLLIIGIMWLFMTIFFEFIFGHYVVGHSWSKLFHDYNILDGHIWILVLLWTAIGPLIIGKILEKKQSDASSSLISKDYNLDIRR